MTGDDNENLEDEIEEILRQKGEKPGKASKPSQGSFAKIVRRLSGLPSWTFILVPLLIGGGLVTFRILGPAAFRLALLSGVMFLISFILRNVIQEFFSRRNRP
tara:strand:- start:3331 stop:3639 length:309 start_codon:yes stop_codon:yes gene_type:complete